MHGDVVFLAHYYAYKELTEILEKNRCNGQRGNCNVSVGRYNKRIVFHKKSRVIPSFSSLLSRTIVDTHSSTHSLWKAADLLHLFPSKTVNTIRIPAYRSAWAVLGSDVICIKRSAGQGCWNVNIGARCVPASVVVLPMELSPLLRFIAGNRDGDVFRQKVNSAHVTADVSGLQRSVRIRQR